MNLKTVLFLVAIALLSYYLYKLCQQLNSLETAINKLAESNLQSDAETVDLLNLYKSF